MAHDTVSWAIAMRKRALLSDGNDALVHDAQSIQIEKVCGATTKSPDRDLHLLIHGIFSFQSPVGLRRASIAGDEPQIARHIKWGTHARYPAAINENGSVELDCGKINNTSGGEQARRCAMANC